MIDIDRLDTLIRLYLNGFDVQSRHCYIMEMLKPDTFCRECERKDICTTTVIDVR